MKRAQLRQLAKRLNVSQPGSDSDLAERLAAKIEDGESVAILSDSDMEDGSGRKGRGGRGGRGGEKEDKKGRKHKNSASWSSACGAGGPFAFNVRGTTAAEAASAAIMAASKTAQAVA